MKNRQFVSIALAGFLIGVVIIVFLQVLSGQNIKGLNQGNENLLKELRIQNELRRIEADIVGLESDVRGAVISQNPVFLSDVSASVQRINGQLATLEELLSNPEEGASSEILVLRRLVQQKLSFNDEILKSFELQGKKASEQLINTGKGKLLRDSIVTIINQLDSSRHKEAEGLVRSFRASSKLARTWGFALAFIACLVVVAAFWYIVGQSQHQRRIIQSLNESERRIKEAAQLKEQFMANMSHEIRTPMNAIIGFSSLLRRTQLDPTQREYLQSIHSAGDNLLALINDILDLSKIEAGMMQLEETRFSIRSLAASVGAMFMDKINEKGLAYRTEIAEEVPDILSGDAVRLTQILVNLLGNAVKFTETGYILLQVSLRYQNDDKVGLRVAVTDTGIGIPPEVQRTIFNRFQQAEAATTRRYGGTGLGLSIVQQLAELQGGSVSVVSQPGKGATFTLDIEYRIPDISEVSSASLVADAATVEPNQIRILIAEDNVMNQQLMRHLMRNWGFSSTIVGNGLEAVEELKQRSYVMVLMDIQMPEMDGYTATGVIREELKLDIPIIAMTAHAMMGEKEKCLQLGMNDYISKPVKELELYNHIVHYAHANAQKNQLNKQEGTSPEHSFEYLDLSYLRQLSGNDPGFEREMMEQFAQQVPEELTALQAAYENGNLVQVKSIAHSLKSTLGYMGLSGRVKAHLDAIEQAARDEKRTEIPPHLEVVADVTRKALAEVQQMLQYA